MYFFTLIDNFFRHCEGEARSNPLVVDCFTLAGFAMTRHKIVLQILFFCASLSLSAQKADTIVLNLKNPTIPDTFKLNANGYWKETYNSTDYPFIEFDLFKFTHIPTGFGGVDVGDGMSYWDGFTYSVNGDTTDYGEYGSSDGWLAHQWGCMAGGGIKTDSLGEILKDENGKVLVEKGLPYLVAYWGYWIEMNQGGDPCLQALFNDGNSYQAVGMYVCNNPWPYYGNIHGDGFAEPFTEEGQYFKLVIHGFNEQMEDIGVTVDYMLAEFKDGKLHQSRDWEWIDLSPLGEVYGFYFTMESTDIHNITELGPNTAVYFCMDKLMVSTLSKETEIPGRPIGLSGVPSETNILFSWSAGSGVSPSGYSLFLDDQFITNVSDTFYLFTDLNPAVSYKLGVEAFNEDGEVSARASIILSTTDETPPSMPLNLRTETTTTTITLTWDASTDNVGVVNYNIFVDSVRVKRTADTTYTITLLDPDSTYFVQVEALDAAGNKSARNSIMATTKKDESTSIQDVQQHTKIAVYPNPTNGELRIEYGQYRHSALDAESLKKGIAGQARNDGSMIEIYNMNGQRVYSVQPNSQFSILNSQFTINISHLPNGTYIVKIGTNSVKIIKQ